MRVLLAGPALGAISGVSTHVNLLLAAPWSSVGENALDLTHFQIGSEGREESAAGRLLRLLASPLALGACLVTRRIDVLHLNTSLNSKAYWRDVVYLGVARLLRRRVILQIHGGSLPHEFFAGRRWATALFRRVLRAADAVVALGKPEWQAFRDFVPDVRVHLIPNAVVLASASASVGDSEQAGLRLLFLGRLDAAKGLFELLEAVAVLVRSGRLIRLLIAGSGSEEATLRARVEAHGLHPQVEFTGARFGADKQALLQWAQVFVLPSHAEGLPYALLEAMAAGIVPVVSAVGSVPDVVGDLEHGLLVTPHRVDELVAALARLDDDRALLARLGVAARARIIERFGLEQFARSFARLYRQVDCDSRTSGNHPAVVSTESDSQG